jgi:hypothetical protein
VEGLGVRYVEAGGGVNITVPPALRPGGGVQVASNLDGAWSMLESGTVDCIFAYSVYAYARFSQLNKTGSSELWSEYVGERGGKTYYVYLFRERYSFAEDPPYEIYIVFTQGRAVRVARFEAFVASFTERGDCVLNALRKMDLSRYGFE